MEAEQQIRKSERQRIAELENVAKEFEQLMSPDRNAFGHYLDKAFDDDERKRGRRPPKRWGAAPKNGHGLARAKGSRRLNRLRLAQPSSPR